MLMTSLHKSTLMRKLAVLKKTGAKAEGQENVTSFFSNFWARCAFHFVYIFHLVEIQSTYCLYVQDGLEFFD